MNEELMPSLEDKEVVANKSAVSSIIDMIAFGQVNRGDQFALTEIDRQRMLGTDGKNWRQYGDCHLGVDESKPDETRMRYVAPVVKNGVVYLKALIKATADDNREVATAAWELCKKADLIADNRVLRPYKSDMACPVMSTGRSCPMNAAGRCAHLSDGNCGLQMNGDLPCQLTSAGSPACPLMAGGEGCPMDTWSGCAQLDEDSGCKLGAGKCCMVKAEAAEEDEE